MQLDWKFISTLILAVAGVAVPVWLWQADIGAKSLTMTVVSTVPIGGMEAGEMTGVEVTVDGSPAEKPFISVIEVHSSGRRPIAAADFETPIEVSVLPPARLLKAQVKETSPPDLRPSLFIKQGLLAIEPLLLNAGDRIQVNVIGTGALPIFSVRSRVAGVQKVAVVDSISSRVARRTWLQRTIGVLLLAAYFPIGVSAITSWRRGVFRPVQLAAAVACDIGGTLLTAIPVSASAIIPPLDTLPFLVIALLLGVIFLIVEQRRASAA